MLVVRGKYYRIDVLGNDVLKHSHLTVDVSAALGSQHEGFDAAFSSLVLDALTDGDVVVELGRRRHVGDLNVLGSLEILDGRLGGSLQRLGRRIGLLRNRHAAI